MHDAASPSAPDVPGHCWVCGADPVRFVDYGLPPRTGRCAACGAKPRHRIMLWYLREVIAPRLGHGARVLEIGAGEFATRCFTRADVLPGVRYVAADLRVLAHHARLRPPHACCRMDAARLGFRDGSFDLVLCNNTLPYVRDDRAALAEMRRCLRADGLLMVQTSRVAGPTREVAELLAGPSPPSAEWLAENGDARQYGEDFFARLAAAGLDWRVDRPLAGRDAAFRARNGLRDGAELVVAFRDVAGRQRFPAS